MQLDASQQEDLEEDDNEDFHILVLGSNPPSNETDVLMEESDFSSALDLDPFAPNILPEELDSAINNMQLEGGTSATVPNHVAPHVSFASSSSSEPVRLESPVAPTPKLKVEENPFSPSVYPSDTDMYPPLPSPQNTGPAPMATPLPQGQIFLNGVYYMPVPAPHNVVVAQCAIPASTKVPCNAEMDETAQELSDTGVNSKPDKAITAPIEEIPLSEEPQRIDEPQQESSTTTMCSQPKVGLEFAMPAAPPPSKKEAERPPRTIQISFTLAFQ